MSVTQINQPIIINPTNLYRHSNAPESLEQRLFGKIISLLKRSGNLLTRIFFPSTLTLTQKHLRPLFEDAHRNMSAVEISGAQQLKTELEATYNTLNQFYQDNQDLFSEIFANGNLPQEYDLMIRLMARIKKLINNLSTKQSDSTTIVAQPQTSQEPNLETLVTQLLDSNKILDPEAEYLVNFIADTKHKYWKELPPINYSNSNSNEVTAFGNYILAYFSDLNIKIDERNKRLAAIKLQEIRSPENCVKFQNLFKKLTGFEYFTEFHCMIYQNHGTNENPQLLRNGSVSNSDTRDSEQTAETQPTNNSQQLTPTKQIQKHECNTSTMDNSNKVLKQELSLSGDNKIVVKAKYTVTGTKTHSSNIKHLGNTPEKDYLGVNRNNVDLVVDVTKNTTSSAPAQITVTRKYRTYTLGSFQPGANNRQEWHTNCVDTVKDILENSENQPEQDVVRQLDFNDNNPADNSQNKKASFTEDPIFPNRMELDREKRAKLVIDFKPLKPYTIPGIKGVKDVKLFEKHTELMKEAIDYVNKDRMKENKRRLEYLPVFGNSLGTDIGASDIESNRIFAQEVISRISQSISYVSATQAIRVIPILNELVRLTKDKDDGNLSASFNHRAKFTKIFTITRILAIEFPGEIEVCGGCESAKDRMQSLIFTSNLLISLYHAHDDNLDFLDANGRLTQSKLTINDIDFLSAQVNNIYGYSFLSEMGVRILNNKNLDFVGDIFTEIVRQPEERFRALAEAVRITFTKKNVLVKTKV
jgi:hypothetical protein